MMVNPRFLSFLMPIVAASGFLLWYKKRNFFEKEEKEGNDSGGGGGGGEDENTPVSRSSASKKRRNSAGDKEKVILGSSLVSFKVEEDNFSDVDNDDEPLTPMPEFDNIRSRNQSESAGSDATFDDDADLSDAEFQQKRVLDWAEERVSISEADLDADLESLLQSCFNESGVDESPSTRRMRMRKEHAARAGSEASGVSFSSSTGSGGGDDGAASSSWRLNSGGDANSLTPRSAWNSLQNTPDAKRSPRNRRLKRSGGYGEDSALSTPSSGKERSCPVISCVPSTPSSGVTSGVTSSASPSKKDGSDSDNWRDHMGQWGELARSHHTPTDLCSTISDDSGRGGSDGVPSLSIASPGDVIIYEFEFPSELCGRLIGKGGKNLQQLMIETNTRLALRKQPFTEDHQIVSVTGRQEDVQSVLQSVRHKFPRHRNPEVDLRPVQMPVPQDLLVPDILPLALPEDAPVEVIVSAVVSTAHIFVQMPTHPTFPNLPHLDACMLACYSQNGAPPLPTPIDAGVICAAPQGGGWYRAQIVEIVPSSSSASKESASSVEEALDVVEDAAAKEESLEKSPEEKEAASSSSFDAYVRFVDYGGYAYVPLTSLRQIRSDFIALPFQAVECYLAYMAPPSDDSFEFPIEGAFYLEKLVKEAVAAASESGAGSGLKAETVAYADGGVPCVYLYSSVGSRKDGEDEQLEQQQRHKISINEALVAHGDAKWIPYYDGGDILGEEVNEAEGRDNFESSTEMTTSTTTSTFTEQDVVSAVVFTPMAMRTASTTSSTALSEELVNNAVEIDVQNISSSQCNNNNNDGADIKSGLESISDCFVGAAATKDILSSTSSASFHESHTTHSSSSSISETRSQFDRESEESSLQLTQDLDLVVVGAKVTQIAV